MAKKKKENNKKTTKAKKKKGSKVDRKKLIAKTVTSMLQTFGPDAAEIVYKSAPKIYLPCKNKAVNFVVSNGKGFPIGRVVEMFGESASGKSLLLYDLFAQAQEREYFTILADVEEALDSNWAIRNGIDPELLISLSCATVEEFFARTFGEGKKKGLIQKLRAKDPDSPIVLGLDSIAALSTEQEMSEIYGKQDFTKARWLSQAFRKVTRKCEELGVLFVVLNQIREKVMVVYGDKETTPGGRAIRFFSSVSLKFKTKRRLELSEGLKEKRIVGVKSRVKVIKNRVGRPFGEADINILFDKGLTEFSGLLRALVRAGIVTRKKGASKYKWGKFAFTKKSFRKFVRKHPEVLLAEPPEVTEDNALYGKIGSEDEDI